jgi:hypothetical protein
MMEETKNGKKVWSKEMEKRAMHLGGHQLATPAELFSQKGNTQSQL